MKRTGFLFLTLSLILAACGTVAAPVFQADLENTQVAQAATSVAETANAPTATATFTITPSPTVTQPPTATPTETATVPPTDTPEPSPTEAPTEAPAASSGSSNVSEVTGDPAAGQVLFNTFVPEASFACATCHLADSENTLICPGLQNVGTRAETRVPGMTAVEYLHQSIVDPSAYVVEGFPDNLMPHVFGQVFTEEQINDLIAYLMTL